MTARELVDDALRESGWDKRVFLESHGGAGFALYWSLTKRIQPLTLSWHQRLTTAIRDIWEGTK